MSLNQRFLIALSEIEERVRRVQELHEAERANFESRVSKAQNEVVEQLPDIDVAEASFPCHEIPGLDSNFLGRSDQLKDIKQALEAKTASSLCSVIVSGIAGVGKSALAVAAAHELKNEQKYEAIFWLNAENSDVLRESFTRIALRLLLKGATDKSDKDRNFMLTKNWLDKTSM